MGNYYDSDSFRKRQKLRLIAQTKVITNLELFAFVLLFLLLFFILFPMGNIKTIILTEEDYNAKLSALYIKGLLRIDNNPRLRFELAKRYVQMNRFNDAEIEISRLKHSPLDIKRKVLLLKLDILERQLFFTKNKDRIRKTIHKTILSYVNRVSNEKLLSTLYRKSLSMNMPDLALIIADKLRKTSKQRLVWSKECLKQTLATSNYQKALECLNFLILHDRKNKDIYLHRAFNIAIGMKDYSLAVSYANQILKLNPRDKKAFAKNYQERATCFKTAVNVAMWHKDYKTVKSLIRKYGYMFLNDRKMATFMLKTAMATGDSKFSEEVADEVFLNM